MDGFGTIARAMVFAGGVITVRARRSYGFRSLAFRRRYTSKHLLMLRSSSAARTGLQTARN